MSWKGLRFQYSRLAKGVKARQAERVEVRDSRGHDEGMGTKYGYPRMARARRRSRHLHIL